jgi:hypothetical protein
MARRNSLLVSRTLYQVGIVTLFVALIWVGIGIYLALNKQANADVDKKILEPINPVIDREVVEALSKRLVVEAIPASESATPAESPSPTPSIESDTIDTSTQEEEP